MNIEDSLIKAAQKQIYLEKISDWKEELLSQAPPILWFGNSKSEKRKIITIGANPSRWEFLDKKLTNSIPKPFSRSDYENFYLRKPRLYIIPSEQSYADILSSKSLRNSIIQSFDNYFSNEPYNWFGKNKEKSYNAEGLLRGLKASYFEIETQYRACHIDFFPFATISDFKKIQAQVERDLFAEDWAKHLVDEILIYLQPKTIIVFGKTNFDYFIKYFGGTIQNTSNWKSNNGKGKCNIWNATYKNFNVIGLSVNLGNPNGFDRIGLHELGVKLSMTL